MTFDILKLYKAPCSITFGNVGSGRGVVATVNSKTGEVELNTEDIPPTSNANYVSDAEKSKLAGIENNATSDQSGSEIKALYEAEPDTNALSDALYTRLLSIEDNATGDMTGGEIKALYEAEPDTNAFTDFEKQKLADLSGGGSGGGTVQADMAQLVTTDASYIQNMGNAGRAIALAEDMDDARTALKVDCHFSSIAEMLSSTEVGFDGAVWQAGEYRYLVLPSTSVDEHLTNAGGAKLRVIPSSDGVYNFAAFNPVADGVTDDHAALTVAIAAAANDKFFPFDANTLYIPNAEYFIGQTIEIRHAMNIVGSAPGQAELDHCTKLKFPASTTGILIHWTYAGEPVNPNPARGVSICGLSLYGTISGDTTAHGIHVRNKAVLKSVLVRDFGGDGVHIVANCSTADPATEGNSNLFQLKTVLCKENGRHGIYLDGDCVNAGVFTSCDVRGNGRWGVYDSSFLGNTYVGCHATINGTATSGNNDASSSSFVHYNGMRYAASPDADDASLVATTPGTDDSIWVPQFAGGVYFYCPDWVPNSPLGTYFSGGAYRTDNPNARNVFIGCYSEPNQAGSCFEGRTLALGGHLTTFVKGGVLEGYDGNEITGTSLQAKDEIIDAKLAGDESLKAVLQFRSSEETGGTWRLRYKDDNIVFDNGGISSRQPIMITSHNTSETMGTTSPKKYVFTTPELGVGSGTSIRRHFSRIAPPTSGEYARGDIAYNINPTAGGSLGWVCVSAGSPGVWKTFGTIEE